MTKMQIYDPALCCNSGVCGAELDQALVTAAADIDWAKQQGAMIERFNLAQQPIAFAENDIVKAFLVRSGAKALPVTLLDGEIALAGRYPTRAELARWAALANAGASGCGCSGRCS